MKMLPAEAIALMIGMLAMLFCAAAPVSATPGFHHQGMVAMESTSDMPCCPEKSTTIKACSQMCPAVATVTFGLAYIPVFRTLQFQIAGQTRNGRTYEPLAPPPR
jgi:hypothetical protein